MLYPILDPNCPDPSFNLICALAIMAKAPRPGRVKTRLSPPLSSEQAAALNTCVLRDTTLNIAELAEEIACAGVISYTPIGDESLFDGLLPAGYRLIPQRGDGFGERLLTTAQDLFQCGFGSVCLIDSDSPTVPRRAFAMAVDALQQPGDRVVLGPSQDGGYYLIGMKHAHAEMFQNISWSTDSVLSETRKAIESSSVELITLPLWYDVDDAATLAVLRSELIDGLQPAFTSLPGYTAEYCRKFLRDLDGSV